MVGEGRGQCIIYERWSRVRVNLIRSWIQFTQFKVCCGITREKRIGGGRWVGGRGGGGGRGV